MSSVNEPEMKRIKARLTRDPIVELFMPPPEVFVCNVPPSSPSLHIGYGSRVLCLKSFQE
jgi:hypothetical protein